MSRALVRGRLATPGATNPLPASPERLRVIHLNYGKLYGGVETILVTLARLRDLCGAMEPSFAVCQEGRLSRELISAGVAVHVLGSARISRPWTVWRARRNLRKVLKTESFDVAICHMPWSLAVFGKEARAAGLQVGFWAHGFHSGRGWLERLARRTIPDVAMGNSRFTEAGLENLFPGTPRAVVYPPVPITRPAGADKWRSLVRQQMGVREDTVVIMQVSRLEPWKGHLLHLRALSQLSRANDWTCWIVGGPQRMEEERYLHSLQQTVSELNIADRVRFLGQRSDIPQLLAAADVFCQPNQGPEPFGIVFVEAMGAGCPVVATAIGGAKEIVNESCGLLVEPGNPTRLAEALEQLIQSPELRTRLGHTGAVRAQELCDPATQMGSLSRLWQPVLRRRQSR